MQRERRELAQELKRVRGLPTKVADKREADALRGLLFAINLFGGS